MPTPSQDGAPEHDVTEGARTSVAELAERRRRATSPEERRELLTELVERYDEADAEAAEAVRQAFLLTLQEAPDVLMEEAFIDFLVNHVEPEDLTALSWEMPSHVVSFSETLYNAPELLGEGADEAARLDALREKLTGHVHHLLSQALHQFEARGEMEKVFQLLQIAPATLATSEAEGLRLRNRAYLHELRRVQRNRRVLYGYLLVQALLVTVIFPLLFINSENGRLQDQLEDATGVEVDETTERQSLSYADGVYWSFITAGSIGYGDVTPKTGMGRAIAAILGVMGVITAGVIAGLILSWVTPRRLS